MYIGYSPYAPGTFGSLIGIPIFFLLSSTSLLIYGIVLIAGFLTATYTASVARVFFSKKDPPYIVCDEIIGYMAGIFLVPFTMLNAIIIFLLFRFFDIFKPFPIRTIDRKMDNGLGIVLDDVLAGVYSNITFHLLQKLNVL